MATNDPSDQLICGKVNKIVIIRVNRKRYNIFSKLTARSWIGVFGRGVCIVVVVVALSASSCNDNKRAQNRSITVEKFGYKKRP